MAFLTSTKASTRVFSVRPSHQALPKTLETGFKRRMVSLGFPVFLAFPTALLLNDPLIWVTNNLVLLVNGKNHAFTSVDYSVSLLRMFWLIRLSTYVDIMMKKIATLLIYFIFVALFLPTGVGLASISCSSFWSCVFRASISSGA